MATNITKIVNTAIPTTKRYQYWKSTENNDDGAAIKEGDIFRIEKSLGKPAKNVVVTTTAGSDLAIRFNSRYQWFVRHTHVNDMERGEFYDNLKSETELADTSMTAITIGSSSAQTFTLDGGLAVSDIEITTWTTGTFTLLVS